MFDAVHMGRGGMLLGVLAVLLNLGMGPAALQWLEFSGCQEVRIKRRVADKRNGRARCMVLSWRCLGAKGSWEGVARKEV